MTFIHLAQLIVWFPYRMMATLLHPFCIENPVLHTMFALNPFYKRDLSFSIKDTIYLDYLHYWSGMSVHLSLIILLQLITNSCLTKGSQFNQHKAEPVQKRNFHLHPIDIKLTNPVMFYKKKSKNKLEKNKFLSSH